VYVGGAVRGVFGLSVGTGEGCVGILVGNDEVGARVGVRDLAALGCKVVGVAVLLGVGRIVGSALGALLGANDGRGVGGGGT